MLTWAKIVQLALTVFNTVVGAFVKKNDQDTGRALQRGDAAQEEIHEVQAVNDARNDPAAVERVREQSFRD